MKTINIKQKCKFIVLLVVLGLNGCASDDFLEVNPKGKLILKKTLEYEGVLNSIGAIQVPNETINMGDDVCALEPFFLNSTRGQDRAIKILTWADDIYEGSNTSKFLNAALSVVFRCNIVINEVMSSTGGTEADPMAVMNAVLASLPRPM